MAAKTLAVPQLCAHQQPCCQASIQASRTTPRAYLSAASQCARLMKLCLHAQGGEASQSVKNQAIAGSRQVFLHLHQDNTSAAGGFELAEADSWSPCREHLDVGQLDTNGTGRFQETASRCAGPAGVCLMLPKHWCDTVLQFDWQLTSHMIGTWHTFNPQLSKALAA